MAANVSPIAASRPRSDASARSLLISRPAPLAIPACALLVGVALSEAAGEISFTAALALLAVCIAAAAGTLVMAPRGRFVTTAALCLAAAAAGALRHQSVAQLPVDHVGRIVRDEPMIARISGLVISSPLSIPAERRNPFTPIEPQPRVRFLLAAAAIHPTSAAQAVRGTIRVTVHADTLDIRPGDRLELTGWLYRPLGARNPGEPDWSRLQRNQGIHAGMTIETRALVRHLSRDENSLPARLHTLRAAARRLLVEPAALADRTNTTTIIDAMVLGQRSAVPAALNDTFMRTGSIHYLTVSGFHVAVLGGAVWLLLRWGLRRSMRTAALASAAAVLLYATIAEQDAPVLRTAALALFGAAAVVSGRPVSVLNWLALAAAAIVLINPLELFRAGFQLSFLQVLTLCTVLPLLYNRLTGRDDPGHNPNQRDAHTPAQLGLRWAGAMLLGTLLVSLCAWAASIPLTIYHFGQFAPWGMWQSAILTPLAAGVVLAGFATMLLGWAPPLALAAGAVLLWLTQTMLTLADWLATWKLTLVEVARPPLWVILGTYGLLALAWLAFRPVRPDDVSAPRAAQPGGRGAARRALAAAVLTLAAYGLLAAGCFLAAPRTGGATTLHVLDVGNGSATLVVAPDGRSLLVDLGTAEQVDTGQVAARALAAVGAASLEMLALSHADLDHYSGVPTLLSELNERTSAGGLPRLVSTAAMAEYAGGAVLARIRRLAPADTPAVEMISQSDELSVGPLRVEVLWPPRPLDPALRENDTSLVVRVRTPAGRSVLIPGDIEQAAMLALLADHADERVDLRSDVLIAPHHGSVAPSATARFYRAVSPRWVIASTGRPRPGLRELVERELGPACRVVTTREHGAVSLRLSGDEIELRAVR